MRNKFYLGLTTSSSVAATTTICWQIDKCPEQIIAIAVGRSEEESKYRAETICRHLRHLQQSMVEQAQLTTDNKKAKTMKSSYRVVDFADGFALFVDCQDLPEGTQMIKGRMQSFAEIAALVEALRVVDNTAIRPIIGQP